MAHITKHLSTTFAEYILLPGLQTKEHRADNISLKTPLVRHRKDEDSQIILNTPFVSAAMQAVTGSKLAIANTREGAFSFIYASQPIEDETDMVRKCKEYKAGFVESKVILGPHHTLDDAINMTKKTNYSTIPITEDGLEGSRLLGILTDQDYWEDYDSLDSKLINLMTPFENLAYGEEGINLEKANHILRESKKSCIPIINSERHLKSLVFKKDWQKHKEYSLELIDEKKKLLVGAAINTRDYEERVPALISAGADALVIDTSDGFNEYVHDTLKFVKENFPHTPIGAGNVVSAEGFRYLAESGADFIKIGIGGGSICITQEVKGIGRGQVSALIDIVKERNEMYKKDGIYIPICSDGGLVQDSHMLIALALGADFVMMGRYYARCEESPPEKKIKDNFGLVKPYWGEGSERAKNWQRYHHDDRKKLPYEEGIDGWVPYAGHLEDLVRKSTEIIKDAMGNIGVLDLKELHKNATLERRSPASMLEGKPHDVQMNTDNLGKYNNMYWGN